MTPVWLIASNTVRETTRRRIFYNVVLFGICLVILAMVVSNITFGFADRVVRSIGLSGISIALNVMSLLVATSMVHEEIDRKTLFVLLTRPVSRPAYVAGRYLGLLLTAALMLLALSTIFVSVLYIAGGGITASDVVALGMALGEAALLGAIGLALSCVTTPTLGAGIGLGIWIIGASTDDFVQLTRDEPVSHAIASTTSFIFPALARLNFREAAVYQAGVDAPLVGWALLYVALYVTAVLGGASLLLSRRDMT